MLPKDYRPDGQIMARAEKNGDYCCTEDIFEAARTRTWSTPTLGLMA
jgi:hypothetical protein